MNAFLSIKHVHMTIKSYEDLLKTDLDLLLVKDSSIEDIFKNSPKGSLKHQVYLKHIKQSPSISDIGGNKAAIEKVKLGEAFTLEDSVVYSQLPSYPCQVTEIPELG